MNSVDITPSVSLAAAPRSSTSTPRRQFLRTASLLTGLLAISAAGPTLRAQSGTIAPSTLPRIGSVDQRFQSYNIEMVEVIGGRFWKPYAKDGSTAPAAAPPKAGGPIGMDPSMFQQRVPIDLSNPRLRKLAAALGPAYVRVSGTWANSVYFQNSDVPPPAKPPEGFNGVLTRAEWKGVIEFSKAVDAEIVTSVATSTGTRGQDGIWTPTQARSLFDYTKSIGGTISATEFMNEPTFASIGGAPKGYDATAFARDVAAFQPFIKQQFPGIIFLGPGSVGEGGTLGNGNMPGKLTSADLLKSTGSLFDAFSYHFYGAVSQRCSRTMPSIGTTAEAALTDQWLSQTDTVEDFYAKLRDQYEPGKPLWITETGEAACGGNPWASTFTDSFRYLYQMGSLAKRGVQVIMHNTLASSDYGLLDQETLTPRPNYWSGLLWHQLMGTTVLEADPTPSAGLHVYAHCLRNQPGGVALLLINNASASHDLSIPQSSQRYTLTSADLASTAVQLNGKTLALSPAGDLPKLSGDSQSAGNLLLAPRSITFLAIPHAENAACR